VAHLVRLFSAQAVAGPFFKTWRPWRTTIAD
jgi:hypothetical protein